MQDHSKAMKGFTVEENQTVWNMYFDKQHEGITDETTLKKKRVSVNQYKQIPLAIDSFCNKPFSELTAQDINDFFAQAKDSEKARINHFRGFLTYCINNDILTVTKSTAEWIIPADYKQIVAILLQK